MQQAAKCAVGGQDHDADHNCGATATGTEAGNGAAAADGEAPTPALTKPAANDGADNAAAPVAETVALAGPASPSPPPSCEADEAAVKAISTKLTWSQALQRAFGWDLLKCPGCGGRRKMIAAIRNPAQVEKILRHVGQWREAGDRDGDKDGEEVIAIRGPPGTFDEEVDETPNHKFDGVDDPVELDWAA